MKSGPDGDGVPGVADLLPLPVATTLEGSGEEWGGGAGGEDPQLRLPLGTDHIIIRHTLEDTKVC